MNYSKIYYKLIESRSQLDRTKKFGEPFEKHHIIPKSLGGSNNKSNLILLTPKEHFVAHRLLYKMHTGISKAKMAYALFRMCSINHRQHRTISSKQYEYAKYQLTISCSGKNNPRYGVNPFTDEKIQEISRRMCGNKNPMYGKIPHNKGKRGSKLTEDHKEKISKSLLGRKMSITTRNKISEKLSGKPKSREHKQSLSSANLGKKLSIETKQKMSATRKELPVLSYTCPHCMKTGKSSAMFRWHFDNCKEKSTNLN